MRWAVSAVLGLVLACTSSPAVAVHTDHIHSSSRFDRSPASLAAQVHRLTTSRADLITWTEVDGRQRRAKLPRTPSWGSYRPRGTDVAVSWRRTDWRAVRGWSTQLGRGQQAGWVLLRSRHSPERALVSVAHLPAHVELGTRWRPTAPAQVAAWRAATASWGRQLHRQAARYRVALVVASADWNVDLRRRVWRQRVLANFPRLRLTWRPSALPAEGTHRGGRLIDGTITNGRGRARLAADDSSSDHRPYRERLAA